MPVSQNTSIERKSSLQEKLKQNENDLTQLSIAFAYRVIIKMGPLVGRRCWLNTDGRD